MKTTVKRKLTDVVIDCLCVLVGTALFAIALEAFLIPNKVSPGGLTGLASILDYLTGIPTGLLSFLLNVPLFIIGIRRLGMHFIGKSLAATIVLSVFIDIAAQIVPSYTGNRLLAALYGGIISGAGLAIVLLRGSSTGGFDIIAKIISLKFPFISIGRVIMLLDVLVIVAAALAYQDIETALYTVITLFMSSKVIDALIYGADKGKLVFIVTTSAEKVLPKIFETVQRGATLLSAKSGYRNNDCRVIMCAIRITEAAKIYKAVKESDSNAFLIMVEAGEIAGQGFKQF